ncbi:hypothetical protein Prum_101350 [Phytohabitans rumicis]|uniref:Uncharacterized protein n=1 Tax=Phytohabitans rumicis TaxID=1076125 RepID=A0A6V8LGW3_9ACTN|nr:hypothetical protein [Phytohabitans rumicis]GFJ96493.1 hypothetical protein Prum_101350 [Phytohabitans rumicis]
MAADGGRRGVVVQGVVVQGTAVVGQVAGDRLPQPGLVRGVRRRLPELDGRDAARQVLQLVDLVDAARRPGHGHHLVAEGQRLAQVVRHEDRGEVGALDPRLEELLHPYPQHRVERAERLVHQQQRRVGDQDAPELHALPHAAGQLPRVPVEPVAEADARGHLGGPLAPLHPRYALDLERKRDVAHDRLPRQQGLPLGDVPDARMQLAPLLAEVPELPAGDLQQAGADVQDRGLAAAAGPDHADEAALLDGEVDAHHRRTGHVLARVCDRHIVELDDWRSVSQFSALLA